MNSVDSRMQYGGVVHVAVLRYQCETGTLFNNKSCLNAQVATRYTHASLVARYVHGGCDVWALKLEDIFTLVILGFSRA